MTLDNLTEIVKNNTVYFSHYKQESFYYEIDVEGVTYTFPVPLEEAGTSTMFYEDKALIFMRYIRKALVNKTFVKKI